MRQVLGRNVAGFATVMVVLIGSAAWGETAGRISLGSGVRVRNVEEPFDYFINSWTVIGLKDYAAGTRITPRGEFVLADGIVCRPLVGEAMRPLTHRVKKTLRKGYLPIVVTDFVVNEQVRYTIEAFACPLPGGEANYDWPDQENYLNLVRVTFRNVTKSAVEAAFGLELRAKSGPVACELRGTALTSGAKLLGVFQGPAEGGMTVADGCVSLRAKLPAEGTSHFVVCIPFQGIRNAEAKAVEALGKMDFDAWAGKTTAFWEALLARGAVVDIPERKAAETYKASLVYQFIGRDKGDIHAGEGFYDQLYLRDAAYQIISLVQAGFVKEAKQSLEFFLQAQRDDGRFETQKGQFDANGYAIWALVEYWRYTGDAEWLARVYPQITKAVAWISTARRQDKDSDSPYFGILPNAIADGEYLWDGKHHIVGYDWQNLRGVQSAALAAKALGQDEDLAAFVREYDSYRTCILEALGKTGLEYIPPSYEKVGTHWGNLEAILPSVLIDPADARLTATLEEVRGKFSGGPGKPRGFVEGTIQWNPAQRRAIHPYMSQFITNTHIIRGEHDEAIDGFYSFLLHTTSTHGFPEGVYYGRREAWSNTVPHLWAAAMYVTTLRNMLVREQNDKLHLLSAVPVHWLDAGKQIRFKRAATHFGRVGLTVEAEKDVVRVKVDPLEKEPPRRTIIHLPPGIEIQSAEIDGEAIKVDAAGPIVLDDDFGRKGGTVRVHVKRRKPTKAMTFASKVAQYTAEVGQQFVTLPGVTAAPAAGRIDSAKCVKIDLSRLATTDPFTAPFNVKNPGKYLFAGLPVGDQVVAGVPMRIIDPAQNEGKGLVVLQGKGACASLPREVVVPVGIQGRFLCVLGNVTGWGSGDPGVGKWGAIGEYEVRYADGSAQRIPLIQGWTADDWASRPSATEAEVALRKGIWHLNLLTIELEAKPVASVVIRDLGTPAAPVVVALTVIK